MANTSQDNRQLFFRGIVYLCGFLLFWEWLRPLEEVTDTSDISIFVIYAAFCFFLSFIQLPWYFSTPLKLVGLAFILDGLYMPQRFLSKEWFGFFYEHIQYNVNVIMDFQWWEMTPLFRSLLFLLLLWLMSYLLYYWFVVAKRISFFVILTIIYLTILDTFTVYEAKVPIIRTFLVSLTIMGVSSFVKEMEKESINLRERKASYIWVIPLILVVLASSVVGYAAPKQVSQWPDPVPFIKSTATGFGSGGSGGSIQKVGYGTNDERLGGSFVQDDSLVFQALAKDDHYWRIETKEVYTGKGWVRDDQGFFQEVPSQNLVNVLPYSDEVKTEKKNALIALEDRASFSKLVYPYGIQKVLGSRAESFELNRTTGEILPQRNGETIKLDRFSLSYNQPSFSFKQLRNASTQDPKNIKEQYTQLPESLPDRVRQLAATIVEGKDNRYDKAKAIEGYFSRNGFEYDTQDIPVPDESEDYVAKFLFETKRGYCDNYSTSMVVLLRSLGIPTRWAKGFTGGTEAEQVEYNGEMYNKFDVKSSNAHSWPEVYFPGVGWVPFEPTQGFSNPTEMYIEETDDNEEEDQATNLPDQSMQDPMQKPESMQEDLFDESNGGLSSSEPWIPTKVLLGIIAGVILLAGLLFFYRFHIQMVYYKWRFYRNPNKENYEAAYLFLLKSLDVKEKITRSPQQSLREYAREVDSFYQSRDMGILTHHYERLLYRNDLQGQPWDKVKELWENLIKKTLS
ncbi:transglutaminase-like domain-containing protein [Pontibacillus marinus]|uniref:Peptidase n=1 Tax=Pontibacillus marinus BH030004 = DSM 16465 TaxID=1385511 RepID=A0A0A5GA31_9BACI|nr:transglutaminase-like domain-containing protein [Pontibacillus marinus]KGX89996.1 peptidase [Pontibacillus marinus BH030004 = DSM 16465]